MVPSHEVFQKPYKVDLQFEDRAVPGYYRSWPGGENLGPTIKVWKVQTRTYPEIDPGLVSDPYGFEDSPDAEFISSGINMKGPRSVALGRHGNFFLWGFAASPKDMTPEARKCFVNSACYIRKFDGQKPVVRKMQRGREWSLLYAGLVKDYGDKEFIKTMLPGDLLRRFGKDAEKYVAYYKENLEYLHPFQEGFEVDEDVKGLGLSNRKVELLDACVSMLERNDRPEPARRILERYTTERFADASRWRSWLDAHRRWLFFTDVGGYKFLVVPETPIGPPVVHSPGRPVAVAAPEPDAQHPVVARAELSPSVVRPGQETFLIVRVETAPSWHIYAVGGSNGPGVATTLKLTLPRGIEADGDWSCPKSITTPDGQAAYEGKLEFRRKIRAHADRPSGPIEVSCELGYMACDPHSCRPPTKVNLTAKAQLSGAFRGQ